MNLSDSQLLSQCEVDTYRASGPGGQKRNKTSSAVRIRHAGTGLLVIAEESRSQHTNKAKALERLRQAIVLKIRETIAPAELQAIAQRRELIDVKTSEGRLEVGRKDPRYWPTVGLVLDVLHALEAGIRDSALALGITTGNLIDFLETNPKVWEQVNILRQRFGQKPLHSGS